MNLQTIGLTVAGFIVGMIITKIFLHKSSGDFSKNLFEMFKSDTSDDNLDRTLTLGGIFALNIIVIIFIFVTDWFFQKDILTDTVIGILIGNVLGWIQSSVTFFFRTGKEK